MPHSSATPRPRLSWSVRTRILAAILAVTAVGMVIAGFTAYAVQRERILDLVDDKLMHAVEGARAVTHVSEQPPDADAATPEEEPQADGASPETTEEVAPRFETPEQVLAAILSRVLPDRHESSLGIIDGKPRFLSAADLSFHLEDDPMLIERIVAEVEDNTVRMGTYIGDLGRLRYIAVPVEVVGAPGTGIFVTAIDLDAELGEITTAFRTYSWVAAATLVAVGVVGWFVAGRLLKPVRMLQSTASRITATDLGERIPVTGNDDLSALTETVNNMLQRIDDSVAQQKQLLDDVRHELKTPVTIVRGHLELLDTNDPNEVENTRALLLDELDRMTMLIDDIALLVDAERLSFAPETVEVRQLMRQIHSKCSALSHHRWVLSNSATETTDIVSLDPARITQAIVQLAENAVKYAAESLVFEIGYSGLPHEARFWVADQGPGIAPEHRERIFQRFGRVDAGRGIQGSGLGLAIVQAIAVSHGGSVTLESSSQGSTFSIVIPKSK